MSRVFLISDHHFSHKKILEFEAGRGGDTVDEHDEWLVAQHNSRVAKRDMAWFLGDVAFSPDALERYVSRMNGTKNLILGNHDTYDLSLYQQYFRKVKAMQPYKGGVLTHIPLHNSSLDRWKINYHGHIHSANSPSDQHINCCVEKCAGIPRTLEEWMS